MAPYSLSFPCTPEDNLGLAQSSVSAFWEVAWWNILWPNRTRESLIQTVAARLPKNLLTDRDVRRHQKVIDLASGEIVGYARWILPESHKDSWLAAQTPEVSTAERGHFDELHAKADFNPRDDVHHLDDHVAGLKQKYKHSQCLELDYLAVHPDHQQKGVGRMLVQSGVDEAQSLGLDVFLLAMGRRALGLYQKAGFELLDQRSQSLSPYGSDEPYETFFMIKRTEK